MQIHYMFPHARAAACKGPISFTIQPGIAAALSQQSERDGPKDNPRQCILSECRKRRKKNLFSDKWLASAARYYTRQPLCELSLTNRSLWP